jgi:hypothetical protein
LKLFPGPGFGTGLGSHIKSLKCLIFEPLKYIFFLSIFKKNREKPLKSWAW